MAWKKNMTSEELQTAREESKAKVKAAYQTLEQGVQDVVSSGRFAEYLSIMSRFHSYSANNCLLIFVQHPTARYVAGFCDWKKKFNRHVKKGEKGIQILAPAGARKYTKKTVDTEGNETEEEMFQMKYKLSYVYADDQTEGDPLPEFCENLRGTREDIPEILGKLVKVAPCAVSFEKYLGDSNGYYDPERNCIVVKENLDGFQKVKTLVHETAHALLHHKGGAQEGADRDTKEIQAESVAYVVCNNLGLNTESYSFDYVTSWAQDKGVKELKQNMDVICKTASSIIDKYEALVKAEEKEEIA